MKATRFLRASRDADAYDNDFDKNVCTTPTTFLYRAIYTHTYICICTNCRGTCVMLKLNWYENIEHSCLTPSPPPTRAFQPGRSMDHSVRFNWKISCARHGLLPRYAQLVASRFFFVFYFLFLAAFWSKLFDGSEGVETACAFAN